MLATLLLLGAAAASAQTVNRDTIYRRSPVLRHLASIRYRPMDKGRKKVAVVLSGGGAKGMAHIGALKVIERAGIPIDIVTGTSMGSIIGGLYSIGYNADVLDSVVRMQDWSYVITDKEDLSKQSLSYRKKQNTYVLSYGLTLGKRNENDGGLIKGKHLAELFQMLCGGYTDSLDFSHDLPIPFACVATNIIDNTEYVFHGGLLPKAMRASMAIPAVFSPVRIGDQVLVDGGLRNNYPADIAREMGADIIIGVTVQGDPKMADDMGHTMSILSQIIDVNCKNKYNENLEITDVPIRVNTSGYSAASFSHKAIDVLIRRGEEEAMKHWDELIALKPLIGIDDSFQSQQLSPLRPEILMEKKRVTGYVFENMTKQDERFLREKFRLKGDEKDSIDPKREQQLTTSMRVDLFYQTAECRKEPDGNGMRVILTAGNRKTSEVSVGARFDTEEYAAVQLGADLPIKGPMPTNADFTLRLGKRLMARGELTIHPYSFTCPTLSYTFRRNDIDIYDKGDRSYNMLYSQHQAEFYPLNLDVLHFNLRFGLRWDYLHYHNQLVSSGHEVATVRNDHYFSYSGAIDYNSENDWNFPTRGAAFKAKYSYITDNFRQLDGTNGLSDLSASWRMSFALSDYFTIQPMAYGRMLFGSVVPIVFTNMMGGQWFGHYMEQQMPFAGMGHIEYTEKQFVAAQLQAQQRIGVNNFVLLRLAGAQRSNQLKSLFDRGTMLGCQLAYYYNSMLGPLGVSIGYTNYTKEINLNLNLGFEF